MFAFDPHGGGGGSWLHCVHWLKVGEGVYIITTLALSFLAIFKIAPLECIGFHSVDEWVMEGWVVVLCPTRCWYISWYISSNCARDNVPLLAPPTVGPAQMLLLLVRISSVGNSNACIH